MLDYTAQSDLPRNPQFRRRWRACATREAGPGERAIRTYRAELRRDIRAKLRIIKGGLDG